MYKLKIYTYDEIWKIRAEYLKKGLKKVETLKQFHDWEKNQKFVKLEDILKILQDEHLSREDCIKRLKK